MDFLGRALIGLILLLAIIDTSLLGQPLLLLVRKGFLLAIFLVLTMVFLNLIDFYWVPMALFLFVLLIVPVAYVR